MWLRVDDLLFRIRSERTRSEGNCGSFLHRFHFPSPKFFSEIRCPEEQNELAWCSLFYNRLKTTVKTAGLLAWSHPI